MTTKENISQAKILMALARIENALADIDHVLRDLSIKLYKALRCNTKEHGP